MRTTASRLNRVARLLWFPDADSCPWHRLRAEHLAFVQEQLQDLSASTRNGHNSALRTFVEEIGTLGWMSEDVVAETIDSFERAPSPRGSRRTMPATRDEVRRLLQDCKCQMELRWHVNHRVGARDAAIIALMYGLGLKLNEIPPIRTKDYDRDEYVLTVMNSKGLSRRMPIEGDVRRALNLWIDKMPDLDDDHRLFFAFRHAEPKESLSKGAVQKMLKERSQSAPGPPAMTAERLRAAYERELREKNVTVDLIKHLTGCATRGDGFDMETMMPVLRIIHSEILVPFERPAWEG